MGKVRHRLKGSKGKRWPKGQSSSSNPSTSKHRVAAKSRFFQENLGLSNLTTDALKKHNDFSFESKKTESVAMEEDVQSFNASTFKTFDTFASDWSACSNQSFGKLIDNFRSNSAIHKEMLAILAAVTEVIKDQGGKETNTEYFGALMTSLSDVELEDTAVAAILNLLGMGIKGVPQGVLQARFGQCSKIFLELLAKYAESENNVIIKGLLGCLSVLLRAQELHVWKEPSTKNVMESMLIFSIHTKPKVRKSGQHAVTAVLKASVAQEGQSVPHPAAALVADFAMRQLEKHGAGTTSLHIMGHLKETLATFPRAHLKSSCESILKVMTLGNVLINNCGLQALHGLFVSHPPPSTLPAELNAKLIAALYDYQPSASDTQPMQAWLAVMQEAYINLNKLDSEQALNNAPRLFLMLATLWLSGPEISNAATLAMRALLEEMGPSAQARHNTAVSRIIATVQAGLKYQYHSAWTHVLHVIGILFKVFGGNWVNQLMPCLAALADLRDTHQFCFTNELDFAVGQAVRAMGPEVVIKAIPLQLKGGPDSAQEFKRSWLLPILKENIQKSTLKCFIDHFMPLAVMCRNQSAKLAEENNQIRALSYDLLQSQLWGLLPSFCNQPSDIKMCFSLIAKPLGSLLSNQKDQRLTVMAALRRLITFSRDEKQEGALEEIARFAKNYLPIMFNLYSTPAKGSDEEGIRLATLETVKVYLTITTPELCSELFDRAIAKQDGAKEDNFVRDSVLDLLRCLVVHQSVDKITELYKRTVAKLNNTKDHKEQKKYYRLLEDMCASDTEGCKQFLDQYLPEIKTLMLDSLSTSAVNSKGPRLRCLVLLLDHARLSSTELITAIVPEAVLCCRDINTRCRQTAYELLTKMADKMAERGELESYVELVMAGLAGSAQLASATLLALATITHHSCELLPDDLSGVVLSNVCLLCCSAAREIVGSALSYFKVFITSLGKDAVASSVPNIVKALVSMTDECKRHFRTKTRDLLARLVRWYGADSVMALVPQSETVMRARLRNMRKIQERKKRQRQQLRDQQKDESDQENDGFSVKTKPKSIDEILATLDESDLEMDEMAEVKEKTKPKKKNNKVWIREGAEDIVDFTDISTAKKISATNPADNARVGQPMMAPKKKESAFKTAPDGRMIIRDNNDSDDDRPVKRRGHVPGLSDSEDEDDLDEARSTVSSVVVGRKRKLSTSTSATATSQNSKYQAGGIGIHRPVKKTKPGTKPIPGSFGAEYKGKKAKGDVKRKGQPDPFAYLPLRKETLNKRKRMKAKGQFHNILKGAKKGANIGVKNKMKMKRKK